MLRSYCHDERSVVKDGAWSGNMAYKQDGTPVLFITAGDDGKVLWTI